MNRKVEYVPINNLDVSAPDYHAQLEKNYGVLFSELTTRSREY